MNEWVTCSNCIEIEGSIQLCAKHNRIIMTYTAGMEVPQGATWGNSFITRLDDGTDEATFYNLEKQ